MGTFLTGLDINALFILTPGAAGRTLRSNTALQYNVVRKGESNMVARTKESSQTSSPVSQLAGWTRQGIESFVAAQKILFDLAAQQNALVIGVMRDRLSGSRVRPDLAIAKIADKGVENITAAGKILLDLAAGETALVAGGLNEGLRLPPAAGVLTFVVRQRVNAFIDTQKRLLDAAAAQTHAIAESYREGKGWMAGGNVAELARRAIEGFVETEKKFLNLVAQEVTAATKGGKEGHTPARDRFKVLTQLARESVEKYIDAQKKLLDLAIEQMEFTGKAAGERIAVLQKQARESWGELTEKSVRNFVIAQKSLMDLAAKPLKASATEETRKTPRARPRHKKQPVEAHKAA